MPRFFVNGSEIEDKEIKITGEDAHHIARSLRMAAGDEITVCDGMGTEYLCTLSHFDDDKAVFAEIKEKKVSEAEPRCLITLYQGYPKGDKLDTIIQKTVECGVSAVIPFESERCVKRPKSDKIDKVLLRLERIAEEAAKQCGRAIIPKVYPPIDFKEALKNAKENSDVLLFCYEGKNTENIKKVLKDNKDKKKIALFVGSEGGFSEKEAQLAKDTGACLVGLGNRILRTETAPVFATANIVYEFDF